MLISNTVNTLFRWKPGSFIFEPGRLNGKSLFLQQFHIGEEYLGRIFGHLLGDGGGHTCLQIHQVRNKTIGQPLVQIDKLLLVQVKFEVDIVRLNGMMKRTDFYRDLTRPQGANVEISYHGVPVDVFPIKLGQVTNEYAGVDVSNEFIV